MMTCVRLASARLLVQWFLGSVLNKNATRGIATTQAGLTSGQQVRWVVRGAHRRPPPPDALAASTRRIRKCRV